MLTAQERAMMDSGYAKTNQAWWTTSPYIFATDYAVAVIVGTSGGYVNREIRKSSGVRPVVSLANDIEVNGNGTYDSPYIIIEK